ncbi:AAA family ATPase [Oceanobacillus jeddahense]|uniref:AAA family ATPase n=1 Tax=Oceanobacillus jeddahense TaxID=1462527 RepID=UPI0005958EE7|nr:AAA family ATPase [Oceanobacillus jeddahense]
MIKNINLSDFNYVFNSSELLDIKKKNFIYGKNGTGKSSLTKAILKQYQTTYDIHVFNGWKGIIAENDRLDSIALGTTNSSILKQIKEIDNDIEILGKEIEEPEDKSVENLYTKIKNSKDKQKRQENKLEKFYTNSAREITNQFSLARSYNKNHFKKDIENARTLIDDERKQLKETIEIKYLDIGEEEQKFISINLESILNSVNEILQMAVIPSVVIHEFNDNFKKEQFAKEGYHIHDKGEKCAFCGNEISSTRWERLDSYFSDEINNLEGRIENGLKYLDNKLEEVKKLTVINENIFYPKFKDIITNLNKTILEKKDEYRNFLENLRTNLEDKKAKMTIEVQNIKIDIPSDFSKIEQEYKVVFTDNREYNENFKLEREKAQNKLRYHKVQSLLFMFDYNKEKDKYGDLQVEINTLEEERDEKANKIRNLKTQKDELIKKSTDETKSVQNINELLKGLGNRAFVLDYVKNEHEQKGQYSIKDLKGAERSIQTLSDGEKNIVAFLWFMHNINKVKEGEERGKEKIVIFDDPMTSNDDNAQYLMIGLLNKYYQDDNNPQIFILTHNNQFFLQATPTTKKYPTDSKPNPNQKYIRLIKVEEKTDIQVIENHKDEIKPLYDELWEELKFAYDNNKPIFMWNNMRRIIETFNKFNYRKGSPSDIERQLVGMVDKTLATALIKSLNVNSHIGYQTDIDISGKTREELKNLFEDIFNRLGNKYHFESYWSR